MKMSKKLAYLRILGYTTTIAVHSTNIGYMMAAHSIETHEDPNIRLFGSLQFRFFTCWNFFLQLVYAVTGLTCEYLALRNDDQLPVYLRGFRDTLFAGVLWPSTFLVFTVFWSLFLYDRELILPPFVDKVLTRTSNHIIHTFIVPIVLWECVLRPRKVPSSHVRNISHLVFHMLLYLSVLFYTYYEKGVWIYPIFKLIYGTIYFPLVILIVTVACLSFYHMQWIIVKMVWGSQRDDRKSKRKVK